MRHLRTSLKSLLLAGGLCLAAAPAMADAFPLLWDSRERMPKPDLSDLPRIRFLTTVDFPPFNNLDQNGRLMGFNIDLANAICRELALLDTSK